MLKYLERNFNMAYSKKELEQLKEVNEILERMEKKLDEAIALFNKPSTLNIKGYPAKNFDWTKKIFSYKTKGNRE